MHIIHFILSFLKIRIIWIKITLLIIYCDILWPCVVMRYIFPSSCQYFVTNIQNSEQLSKYLSVFAHFESPSSFLLSPAEEVRSSQTEWDCFEASAVVSGDFSQFQLQTSLWLLECRTNQKQRFTSELPCRCVSGRRGSVCFWLFVWCWSSAGLSGFYKQLLRAVWADRWPVEQSAPMQTVLYANGNKCQRCSNVSHSTVSVNRSEAHSNEPWPPLGSVFFFRRVGLEAQRSSLTQRRHRKTQQNSRVTEEFFMVEECLN